MAAGLPIDDDLRDEIVRMKTEEYMNIREISDEVGITQSRVMTVLAKAGVPIRTRALRDTPPISPQQFDKAMAARRRGLTSIETSEQLGIPLVEVNAAWGALIYERYAQGR